VCSVCVLRVCAPCVCALRMCVCVCSSVYLRVSAVCLCGCDAFVYLWLLSYCACFVSCMLVYTDIAIFFGSACE